MAGEGERGKGKGGGGGRVIRGGLRGRQVCIHLGGAYPKELAAVLVSRETEAPGEVQRRTRPIP